MTKRSFLVGDRPTLVSMVQGKSPERIRELMRLSLADGAEAFGMQFCQLPAAFRTPEVYRDLFSAASPLPTYVTNYRNCENRGKDDDTLAKEVGSKGVLVNAVSPGSVSPSDIPDMDHVQESELSYLGRTGSDRENAELICFLCGDRATYLSGENIQIDGCRRRL